MNNKITPIAIPSDGQDLARAFYGGVLGFDIASRYPGASFFGSGGYHHQLAGNVWNSRRAGPRPDDMAGLHEVELVAVGEVVRRPQHPLEFGIVAERARSRRVGGPGLDAQPSMRGRAAPLTSKVMV